MCSSLLHIAGLTIIHRRTSTLVWKLTSRTEKHSLKWFVCSFFLHFLSFFFLLVFFFLFIFFTFILLLIGIFIALQGWFNQFLFIYSFYHMIRTGIPYNPASSSSCFSYCIISQWIITPFLLKGDLIFWLIEFTVSSCLKSIEDNTILNWSRIFCFWFIVVG